MSTTAEAVDQELFWSELMDQLAGENVIPIIGPALLEADDGGVPAPLSTLLARRTLEHLGIESECGDQPTLNDVVLCYLAQRSSTRLQPLYAAVHHVVTDPSFPIPATLRTLARVEAFQLFVTTAPDPLLRRALQEERPGHTVRSYTYSIAQRPQDLPAPLDEIPSTETVVYHLLGQTAVSESYALTEEDTLEFVHSLQSTANRPEALFHELRTRSLLVIGSGYSDWLSRFFLRVTRGERLRASGPSGFLAEPTADGDDSFVRFLRHFSGHTQVFPGDPRTFVQEMEARWRTYSAARATPAVDRDGPGSAPARPEPQSIFLSYAHEDRQTVELLVNQLREARLPVWFDQMQLRSGDDFELEIRSAINRCSLFIPILSQQLRTYDKRFFFREWRAAVAVSASYGGGRRFILPCRIDDVPLDAEQILPEIRALDVDDVVDDGSRANFVARVRSLFRAYQLAQVRG